MIKKKWMGIVVLLQIVTMGLTAQQTYTYEAERGYYSSGAVESVHPGYSGTGYVNTANDQSAYFELTFEWTTENQEQALCLIRFANGGSERPMQLYLNNQLISEYINFPPTGWETWEEASITLPITRGTNTLKLESLTAEGAPNLDKIAFIVTSGGLPGDVDDDGVVNIIDALKTAQYYVGLVVENFKTSRGDMNDDGAISILDALIIAQQYVGLIPAKTPIPVVTPEPTPTPGILQPVTLYIAGDSTVMTYPANYAPQAGWGQFMGAYLNSKVTVENRAIGGRTSRRFIEEGRLDAIWNDARPGDWLMVQFGTNDGHRTATYTINGVTIPYYLDPQTDFKDYLKVYIDGARQRGINIILITPPPRNSAYCTGGNGTGAHAQGMRKLGQVENVPVVDLNMMTVNHLKAICPAPQPEDFFLIRANGTIDGTHFQENGARIMAGFISGDMEKQGIKLKDYLQ